MIARPAPAIAFDGTHGSLVRMHPLRILKPRLEIPGFTMCHGWHEIDRNDPGHRWLRDALINVAEGKKLNEGPLKNRRTAKSG